MSTNTIVIFDFYKQCEDGMVKKARGLTSFFENSWQVSDDDTVLSKGADYFIIYRPGAFPILRDMQTKKFLDVVWNITVDFYVRYKAYKESWDKFKSLRAAVFYIFNSDSNLSNTPNVFDVVFSSSENAQYFRYANSPEEAKPNFIIQTGNIAISQRVVFKNQ